MLPFYMTFICIIQRGPAYYLLYVKKCMFLPGRWFFLRCVVTGNKYNSLGTSVWRAWKEGQVIVQRLLLNQLSFQPQNSLICWSFLVLNHYRLKSHSVVLPIAPSLGVKYAKSVVCVHTKFHVVLSTWQATFSLGGVGWFFFLNISNHFLSLWPIKPYVSISCDPSDS